MNEAANTPLLDVENLEVTYETNRGAFGGEKTLVKAVRSVSFSVAKGTTVGLVGESGSGKSTIGKAISRITPIAAGRILYQGEEISALSDQAFMPYRKKIQTIFQDPYASMNPRMNIASIIAEPLQIHEKSLSKSQRDERVALLLEKVGLPTDVMKRYPFQFSGGQRQRICIARALSSKPEFIICDECVSALDVSVQAQIVNLLQDIQEEMGITYLFIAHDLAVVEHMSDQVLVMSDGELVEVASSDEIYQSPKHAYTKKLLDAVPKMPTILKSSVFQ